MTAPNLIGGGQVPQEVAQATRNRTAAVVVRELSTRNAVGCTGNWRSPAGNGTVRISRCRVLQVQLDVSNSNLVAPNRKLKGPNRELDAPNRELGAPNSKLKGPNSKLELPTSKLALPNSELNDPNYKLNASNRRLRIRLLRFEAGSPVRCERLLRAYRREVRGKTCPTHRASMARSTNPVSTRPSRNSRLSMI